MEDIRVSEPLHLNGAKNVRDLGGYPIGAVSSRSDFNGGSDLPPSEGEGAFPIGAVSSRSDFNGGSDLPPSEGEGAFPIGAASSRGTGELKEALTAERVFLRADGLQNLTDEDIETLVRYGVRRVIDLRSDMEVKNMPDRVGDMEYFRVAMWDQMNSSGFQSAGPESIFKLYQSLLDNFASEIGQVMHLMAEVKDGAVLFHCTAGKDRTGVIAMLLLELAGVPDDFIIADYAVTEKNMEAIFKKQKEQARANGIEIQDYMFGSKPEDMRQTLDYFHQKYGKAGSYLVKNCGCSEAEIAFLKVRLGVRAGKNEK